MVENTQFEVEVPTSEIISSTIDGQHTMSHNYLFTHDRVKREIVQPQRYDYTDLICYALNVDEDLQDSEPNTFREVVKNKNIQRWLMEVNDDMN